MSWSKKLKQEARARSWSKKMKQEPEQGAEARAVARSCCKELE